MIWARAKARRDRAAKPATVEETILGIQRRLRIDGAKLLLARRDDAYVGFSLFAPRSETLEVFYLAVVPESWGSGVASKLLGGTEDYARDIGRTMLELWVISSNERAISVYERSGFVRTEQVKCEAPSGQTERRFRKRIC
ncbi:GNAT family N-acetyltransferase [Arthrobacter sp. TMN-49]